MSSGVAVPDQLVEEVKQMKLGKLDKPYRFLFIKFAPNFSAATHLEVAHRGEGDYSKFVEFMKGDGKDGGYAVVDVPLKAGGTQLTLISYAPDEAGPLPKMLVASTRSTLQGKIDGVQQYQASDLNDLAHEQVLAKIEKKN